jgi:hypothetical protein
MGELGAGAGQIFRQMQIRNKTNPTQIKPIKRMVLRG